MTYGDLKPTDFLKDKIDIKLFLYRLGLGAE
jgi:hypothetical protein